LGRRASEWVEGTWDHLNAYVHSDCTGDRDKADGNLEDIRIGLLKKKEE
jgi:hypothetical protein